MHNHFKILIVNTVCLLISILYVFVLARFQLNIVVKTKKRNVDIFMVQNDERIMLKKKAIPENNSLKITIEKANIAQPYSAMVVIDTPRTLSGGYISPDQILTVGKWKKNINNNIIRLTSNDLKSELFWEGRTSGLVIPMLEQKNGGIAKVNWNGELKKINLNSPERRWKKVYLASNSLLFYSTLPLRTKSISLETKNEEMFIEKLSIVFGNKVLFEKHPKIFLKKSFKINLPNDIFFITVFYIIKNIGFLIFICVYLGVINFLIGFPVTFLLPTKTSYLDGIVISAIVGFCFFNTTVTSLIYLISFRSAFFITIGIIILLYLILLWKRKYSIGHATALFRKLNNTKYELLNLFLIASSSLIIFFSPAIIEPDWFLGRSLTDSFYYINQAQNLISNPNEIPVMFHSLFTIRFADLVTLATNAFFTFSDTKSAFIYSSTFLWFLLPFVFYCFFCYINKNRTYIWFLVYAASLSANIYSLYSFNFLAHFYFCVGLIFSVYIGTYYINEIKHDDFKKINIGLAFPVAIVFSYNIAVYAYHFFIPLSITLTLIIINWINDESSYIKNIIKSIFILCGLTIVFTNINLILPFASLKQIAFYNDRLNSMTKIVFPFYNSLEFGNIIYGLKDLGRNGEYLANIISELFLIKNNWVGNLIGIYQWFSKYMLFIVVSITIFALSYGIKSKKKTLLFLSITIGIYLMVVSILFYKSQLYGFAKLLITSGVLLSVMMITGISYFLSENKRKAISFICIISLIMLIVMNIISGTIENSMAFLNRKSQILNKNISHLSTVNIELKKLENVVQMQKNDKNKKVIFVGDWTEYKYTDKDRVLNNRILHIFRDYKLDYLSNEDHHYYLAFDFGYSKKMPKSNSDYLLIFNGFYEHKANFIISDKLLETDIFSFYKLDRT